MDWNRAFSPFSVFAAEDVFLKIAKFEN